MKNFSLTQLKYILALEECRNFGLAAKKCHVSQPTLSMQIQKMEDELGVEIFDRSRQPVLPTPVGQKILDQAKRIAREARLIEEVVSAEKGEVVGEYRLGVIPSLSPYLLPLFLPKFAAQYPKVTLVLEELLTDQLVEKLKKDELDGGILVTPLHDDAIAETPVFYEPFLAYVSEKHPLLKAEYVRAGELDRADLWLLREGHCFRGQAMQLCRKDAPDEGERVPDLKLPVRFESGSLDVLKRLVDQNFGTTLLPELAARNLVLPSQKNRLKTFASPVPVREVSLIRTRLVSKKKIAEALATSIRESVPPELRKRSGKSLVELAKTV